MEEKRTAQGLNGLIVRFALTALLLSLTATAYSIPTKRGEKEPSQVTQNDEPQQPKRKISGQLLDEQGEPLIGASISVKGTSEKAITDINGNFRLMTGEDAPVLVFSYMGFQTKEVALSQNSMVDGGWSMVNVEMSEDTAQLEEVVVTALGIKREKKMLGYAVQDLKG